MINEWSIIVAIISGGGMVSIARKNLFHDKGRLAITLIGIGASVLLILFSMGMFIGTIDEAVYIIDNNPKSEVWVVQDNATSVLGSSVIQDSVIPKIKELDDVEDVNELIYMQGVVEEKNEQVLAMITGFSIDKKVGGPWELTEGDIKDLKEKNSIIYDQSFEKKFDNLKSPQINGIKLKIKGKSKEAKWFISPYVFMSLDNARNLLRLKPDQSNFLLVQVESGKSAASVAKKISKIDGIDALSAQDIRANSRNWMIFESGMGIGIGTMALVGLFVAAVIVSLTVYTATMERLPEFGTLKAIGASKKELYFILLQQVFIGVTLGYIVGLISSIIAAALLSGVTLMPIFITPFAILSAYIATLSLSVLGSLFSMRRVHRVDPAIVFRA